MKLQATIRLGLILNAAGGTGNEFASFILGQVDNANFSAPFKYMPRMKYGAIWANDDIKVLSNLNITIGLRFDWQGDLHEEYGRFSTFDPSAPNPVGVPGATIFHSSKANGKSSWNVGPRFGFAYSFNPKTVIRGGYGMYYAGVQADSWDPYPVDGYQTNPVAPNTTNGLSPAFYFAGTGTCPTTLTQLPAHPFRVRGQAAQSSSRPSCGPDVAKDGNPVGVDPRTYTMPRYQNWSVSFQRQLSRNMGIDIAYVGNHGTRLVDGRSSAGVYDNMNPASVLSMGANPADLTGAVCLSHEHHTVFGSHSTQRDCWRRLHETAVSNVYGNSRAGPPPVAAVSDHQLALLPLWKQPLQCSAGRVRAANESRVSR